MAWTREQANAAARAYRERNREAVRERDRARSRTTAFKLRVSIWRQANAEALRERDRRKRLLSVRPQIAGQRSREAAQERFYLAMTPTTEDLWCEHEAWLESIDLWRMAEAAERADAYP